MDDLLFTHSGSPRTPVAAWLCVLASGSSGNCSVLVTERNGSRQVHLIDAGLSPRRTRVALAALGLAFDEIHTVLITHLDHDHWNPNMNNALPERAWFVMHKRHTHAAQRHGMLSRRTHVLEEATTSLPHFAVSASLGSHDEHGVCVFRFEFGDGAGSLGFATDLGRVSDRVAAHLAGVDVLAIESNYCPDLQRRSPRPVQLKNRIMGGAGHLSNPQCAEAVSRIAPREHVVLLHLSQECNRPELAAAGHTNASYTLTIASQNAPTERIRIGRFLRVATAP